MIYLWIFSHIYIHLNLVRLNFLKVIIKILHMSSETTEYTCKKCKFTTSHRTSFYRHKSSNKHTGKQSNKTGPKVHEEELISTASDTNSNNSYSNIICANLSKRGNKSRIHDHVGKSGIDFSDMLVNK
jgi:hypothetical protein